jgi:hypothetical protein
MKTVIQRNLDLSKVYTLEGINYISLIDGGGTCCDNCNKLISNIAELKCDRKSYYVGLDCMDTILQQSQTVLSWDDQFKYNWVFKAAIQKAKSIRAKILKLQKKHGDKLIVTLTEFPDKFGFSFDVKDEKWGTSPLGWDYGFDNDFKEITLGYVAGLINENKTR